MFTVTQHAGLGLAKHLLDWAGVHTGHSAEAAVTIAAEAVAAVEVAAAGVAVAGPVAVVVAAAAAVAAVELVAHSEFAAAAAVVAQAERRRGVSFRETRASESRQWPGARKGMQA